MSTIVATVSGRQAVNMSVAANVRIRTFVVVRSLGFRTRVRHTSEFPQNAVMVMISIILDSIATRYLGLEESSLKYLGASHQNVSYKLVELVVGVVTFSMIIYNAYFDENMGETCNLIFKVYMVFCGCPCLICPNDSGSKQNGLNG